MREFKYPDQPDDLEKVQAMDGSDEVFRIDRSIPWEPKWVDSDGNRWDWHELVNDYGGVIELEKTPAEKAIEFFDQKPAGITYGRYLFAETSMADASKHTQALIDHAKETVK